MGSWFWLNVPLGLLFIGCWAGIPLYLVLTRWHREVEAKHAEIAARAAAVPAAIPAPAADEAIRITYAEMAGDLR